MSRTTRVSAAVSAFAAALLAAVPGRAAITWDLAPPGTGAWDWTLSGEDWNYQSTDPVTGIASAPWSGIAWSPAAAHCIELATSPGEGTSNPDTRIWINSTNGSAGPWKSINDDFGSTLQSRARIWIGLTGVGSLEYYLKIAAYSSSHNLEDFHLSVTRRDLTQAACTTGQTTIPWASIVGNGSNFTVTLGPTAS